MKWEFLRMVQPLCLWRHIVLCGSIANINLVPTSSTVHSLCKLLWQVAMQRKLLRFSVLRSHLRFVCSCKSAADLWAFVMSPDKLPDRVKLCQPRKYFCILVISKLHTPAWFQITDLFQQPEARDGSSLFHGLWHKASTCFQLKGLFMSRSEMGKKLY